MIFFRTVALAPQHSQADCFVVPLILMGLHSLIFLNRWYCHIYLVWTLRNLRVQMICQPAFSGRSVQL